MFSNASEFSTCNSLGNLRSYKTIIIMTPVLAPKAANLIIWINGLCGKQMNLQQKYKIYISCINQC